MGFTGFVALRFLGSRRSLVVLLVSILAVGGIAMGVLVMNVTLAVMNGFRDQIQLGMVQNMPMVTVLSYGGAGLGELDDLVERVEEVEGVEAASPYLRVEGVFSHGRLGARNRHHAGVVWGIDSERQVDVTPIDESIVPEFQGFSTDDLFGDGRGLPGIVLGIEVAASLRAGLGDVVTLVVPLEMDGALEDIRSTSADFAVVGTLETGMFEFDNSFAYIALDQAQQILGREGEADGVGIRVEDMMRAEEYGDAIATRLGPPYWTNDWIRLNSQLFEWIAMEKTLMFLLLSLMTLISSFAVIAILTMVVRDRQFDIGVLRSLGVTRGQIVSIFLRLGTTLGLVGTLLGTVLGLGVIAFIHYVGIRLPGEVYFVDEVPANVKALDVALVAGVTMLLAFCATVLPSVIASRFSPVDILRHE